MFGRGIFAKIDYGIVRFVKMGSVKVITSLKHVNEFLLILPMRIVHFRQNLV
jgi:hypothetical protein